MMSMWSRLATELAISMTPEEYEEPVIIDEKPLLQRVINEMQKIAWLSERQILEIDPFAFVKGGLFQDYHGKAYIVDKGCGLWALTARGKEVLWVPE